MGNIERQKAQRFSILNNAYSWEKIGSLGLCEIVKDKITGLSAQSYVCNPQNRQHELNVYQFRTDNKKYLPKVLSISQLSSRQICSTDLAIKVVIERIPYRLIDLGHLGYGQGLYILQRSLKGAQIIFRKTGGIHFDDSMICLTANGKSKIWLNENLSKNHPEIQIRLTQKQVVLEVMTIVETRMGGEKFVRYMKEKKNWSIKDFKSGLEFVKKMKENEGVSISNIILPNECESIKSQDISLINQLQSKEKQTNTTSNYSEREENKQLPIEYAKNIEKQNEKIQLFGNNVSPYYLQPKRQIKRVVSHNRVMSYVKPGSKDKQSLSPFIRYNKNGFKEEPKQSQYFTNNVPQQGSGKLIKSSFAHRNMIMKPSSNLGNISKIKKESPTLQVVRVNENSYPLIKGSHENKGQKIIKMSSQPMLNLHVPYKVSAEIQKERYKRIDMQVERIMKRPLVADSYFNNKAKLLNRQSHKIIRLDTTFK